MKELFSCAMDIGEQMLICGAEVHRVEDSMQRICSAIGAKRTDVFIITSSMVVTLYTAEGETYTQTRRITSMSTDIEKLHRLNKLSRKICEHKMSAEEIRGDFEAILSGKSYPFWLVCVSYMTIAAAFAIFFGGYLADAAVALVIGGLMSVLVLLCDRAGINNIFTKFISSFMVSTLALAAMKLGIIETIDKAIIGNIMLLIPGVGLTNGLRDLFAGDSIAGILRLIEAILTAGAIAAGYFLFAFLMGGAI